MTDLTCGGPGALVSGLPDGPWGFMSSGSIAAVRPGRRKTVEGIPVALPRHALLRFKVAPNWRGELPKDHFLSGFDKLVNERKTDDRMG